MLEWNNLVLASTMAPVLPVEKLIWTTNRCSDSTTMFGTKEWLRIWPKYHGRQRMADKYSLSLIYKSDCTNRFSHQLKHTHRYHQQIARKKVNVVHFSAQKQQAETCNNRQSGEVEEWVRWSEEDKDRVVLVVCWKGKCWEQVSIY